MKKYRVSKFTSDILIIGLVVLLVALVLDNFLIFQGYEDMDFKTFIPTVVFLIGIACIIYMMYTGVTAYKFSVSYTGITMYEQSIRMNSLGTILWIMVWPLQTYHLPIHKIRFGSTLPRDVSGKARNVFSCEDLRRNTIT